MIVRKIFEFLKPSYEKIDTWMPLKGDIKQIEEKDRVRLIKIFPQLRKPIETGKAFTSKTKLIYKMPSIRVDIDILVDSDEWFYVRNIWKNGNSSFNQYFKCDQFEGVVDCIKKEIIEKS